ncbi:unnamed protein product [Sphagnum jensenii]|uniref:Initiation factor eIF2 gamma C-terminal domain-containing protein n=1 Tax=Sphagnum jensenii TaxID=128206 RepID=A0ABP0VSG4_9BRYO
MKLKHIIILQNKIDLIQESVAINQHESIQKFIQGMIADGALGVPISGQLKYNVHVVWDCVTVKNDLAKLHLTIPVCTSKGEKVAPSR